MLLHFCYTYAWEMAQTPFFMGFFRVLQDRFKSCYSDFQKPETRGFCLNQRVPAFLMFL